MNNSSAEIREQMLHDAANHLRSALDLLDRAAAPGHIGAQLDHLLHQLGSVLSITAHADVSRIEPGIVRH